MLFNSDVFIFAFLPLTAFFFFVLARRSTALAAAWLVVASLFFYGWWSPKAVPLLVASILANYSFGYAIGKSADRRVAVRKALLWVSVGANLLLLCYFKYANFFAANFNTIFDGRINLGDIVLPLGISFFTFTQIAFLVDTYRREANEYSLVHYALFVTYFPHLIAGPILHHKEMMPQFARAETYRLSQENVAVGLTIFFIGLFKKMGIADSIAPFVAPAFDAAARGEALTFLDAAPAALAYTFQLYFDFSGYSDMAIGLSRLFGIKLPLNFDSPYKAASIIDFWRRWHMTLSRFLRDYLYIPLGGNRNGPLARHLNLMATMLLGGLWHGAAWTFVIWGGLHGIFLVINHAWRALRYHLWPQVPDESIWGGRILTFLAVVVAWIFFRSANLDAALAMLKGISFVNGLGSTSALATKLGLMPEHGLHARFFGGKVQLFWLAALLAACWLLPNTQEIMRRHAPASGLTGENPKGGVLYGLLVWHPSIAWFVFVLAAALFCLTRLNQVSEFLYFQF